MSTDGERSPKRPRFNSYSPASPAPLHHEASKFADPHTPPPSVRMSPSWQSSQNTTALSHKRSYDQSIGAGDAAELTPPSTAGLPSAQGSVRGAGSEAGGLGSEQPTPAAEPVTELERRTDGDGDSEMQDSSSGFVSKDAPSIDVDHRRTDHERHQGSGAFPTATSPTPIPGAKALYKLSTAPIPRAQPHASQNVLALYNLRDIQASVARKDPVTGAKINRLRKSYEGKLKLLGLEGRNKAQANQRELEGLAEEAWDDPQPDGRSYFDIHFEGIELGNAAAEANILGMLGNAFSFMPGRLPGKDHDEWKNTLGLDDATATGAAAGKNAAIGAKGQVPNAAAAAIARTAPSAVQRSSAPASPANARPDRPNKRRRYDDASFEGYENDDGYSTGGGSGSQKRQKRKDFASSTSPSTPGVRDSPSFGTNTGSNGNMVGVRIS